MKEVTEVDANWRLALGLKRFTFHSNVILLTYGKKYEQGKLPSYRSALVCGRKSHFYVFNSQATIGTRMFVHTYRLVAHTVNNALVSFIIHSSFEFFFFCLLSLHPELR